MTRDGEPRLASSSEDGTVRDPSSRSELQNLEGHRYRVYGVVAFKLNDAICLASCSIDNTVRVWDPTSGRELHKLEGYRSSVNGVTVFKINEEAANSTLSKATRIGCVVAFEAIIKTLTRLASSSEDKTVRVWDPIAGKKALFVLPLEKVETSRV
ncbi:hypothetical protein CTAYLR_008262 [Chrysophaeum taylorii]|uniref:Uncharacterized protein n=1 Tax=Chrysophaeum taylorii TaxID=2483200 RepID=A0AAD7XI24_9STRA|nr:hypothetical protein CTAYLR_008262 [Chrysophaeum taylorii]